MDAKFGGFVIDLNETPLPSPREAAVLNDDDVVIIERPFTSVKKEKDVVLGGVACVACGVGFKGKVVGNIEDMKDWKCFKCLLKNGAAGPSGGGRVGFLDINASPPREAEGDGADGIHQAGGHQSYGSKVQVVGHSSLSAHPRGLFSAFSNISPPEKSNVLVTPQLRTDVGKSRYNDIMNQRRLFIASSSKSVSGSTSDGTILATHTTPTDHQTPNVIYLQGLRDYISERNGVLDIGWRVEFEFCHNRLKTFAIYIAPDGNRFESMSDVAQHLGLSSNFHSLQSMNAENGFASIEQTKESSGAMKAVNSNQRESITSSGSLRASSLDVECLNSCQDGFPVQFEDFYLISAGTIDLRPSYHNAQQIWPVGFRSCWHDKITGSLFLFDISNGGDSGPVFKVQRYPCTIQSIPIGLTILTRAKLVSPNGEDNAGKDYSATLGTIDEESALIQMMLTESSPPHLGDDISSTKMRNEGLNSQKLDSSPLESFSLEPGNFVSHILGQRDSVGEFVVEGRSPSSVWKMVSETFLHACREAYKQKGVIQFGCDHGLSDMHVKQLDKPDSLSKFSPFAVPIKLPCLIRSDDEFQSTCQLVAKWLEEERFGLDTEFVQEIVEQLPGVTGCLEYKVLSKRKHHSGQQTVRSGFLQVQKKNDRHCQRKSDFHFGNLRRPSKHPRHLGSRAHFPRGRAFCSKLHGYLIGDALQAWKFFLHFSEVLGLQEAFSFEELESELINPWLDGQNMPGNPVNEMDNTGDVSSRMDLEVFPARSHCSFCRCTGMVLSKAHASLLKVLIGELLSKVAGFVEAGESKSRQGRKKDAEYSAIIKKITLDMIPVNDLTWPEIGRRFILAVLSMDGNLESPEIACRESGKVFHCLRGDGGILCGSLTGVAALEADALLLAEATKQIFGSVVTKSEAGSTNVGESDAKTTELNAGEVPEWAQVLEPVRKLPTNVGARIRRCVNEALLKNPPEWAKKKLEHSISKEVYKGNASGPTKRAVIAVLEDVNREIAEQKPEKKEKPKTIYCIPDLIMKQCRIVLRRAAAADEDRVFCNLLGRTLLNPDDNDEEGLLGYPAMVSRPLDFRTIDLKLAAGAYGESHEAFIDDIREVWHNIRIAFREQSDLLDLAETLSQQFEDLYEKEVLSLIQKTRLPADANCASIESEKEGDDILACLSESSIPKAPWEDGICKVCGMDKDDDNVLLCDSCDSEYHTYCLNPPLVRIPDGNWYCPLCVSGQSMSLSAPFSSYAVKRQWKGRHQRKYLHKNLEMLAQLASAMELNEYWEFSVEERVFLMKFLCDEALNSAILRDHIGQCSIKFGDMQQTLCSLNSERKLLKFKEENLVANMAKTKGPMHLGGGDSGSDAGDGKLKVKFPEGHHVSPLPGCLKPEESQLAKDQSGYNATSITETSVSDATNRLHPQSGADDINSNHVEGAGCKNELSSVQHKDDQYIHNAVTDLDLSQEFGVGSSSASMPCTGPRVSGQTLSDTAGEHSVLHFSSQCLPCSIQANGSSPKECYDELRILQNEINVLQDSIDKLESELLKLSIRKEYLGRDSDGRIYWVYGRPCACPCILVNGCLNAEGVFESDNHTINFTSWVSYRTRPEIEELVNWLGDGDVRDRELKESISHWQCNKSMDFRYTENDVSIGGKEISSLHSSVGKPEDSDLLVTKALKVLQKKFGPCLEVWASDTHKNLPKGKIDQGTMYRCECLELLWSSCPHCFSCHKSFPSVVELALHAGGKCKTVSESIQKSEDSLMHKKILRNEKSAENCSDSASAIPTSLNEKRDNGSRFFDHQLEPDCPFNFQEIMSKFKIETSFKELVKEIGLIGSNGVVSFVPSRSLYFDDPSLTLAPSKDDVVSLVDAPSFSNMLRQQSDNGENNGHVKDDLSVYMQSSQLDNGHDVGNTEFVKPMLPKDRCQKDRSTKLGISKSSIVRESSLVSKVGKAYEILRCLKINLLDMDSALPEASLKPSRSHFNRRCAWRTFVKSASTIYEMVQATIIVEDMIKTDYLRNDWWYWSSPSSAANISTLSALALRIYTLDSAIMYEKPSLTDDTAESVTPDGKSDKEAQPSPVPLNNLKHNNQLTQKIPDSDSGENSKPRTRASKRRREAEG